MMNWMLMARQRMVACAILLITSCLGVSQEACAEAYDVYILTGQDNALGMTQLKSERSADVAPGQADVDGKIDIFWSNVHADNQTYPPKLYGDSGGKIVPLQQQQGEDGQGFWGPEFGLARSIAATSTRKVLIIKACRRGGGNAYWVGAKADTDTDAGHMARHLYETIDSALKILAQRGDTFEVMGLVYLQGESNTADQANVAGKRLASLYQQLRVRLNRQHKGSADRMRLVIGEIGASDATDARRVTNQRHQELAESDPCIAFVATHDLKLHKNGVYFDKSAKLQIGIRLARAFKGLDLIHEQHLLANKAQGILDTWRSADGGDVRGPRPLVITLFTGSDTEPAPNYRERLTRTMDHIQAFYADEMNRHGFGPITFGLSKLDDGLLDIHVVRGDKPNAQYNRSDGNLIRKTVLKHLKDNGIDASKQTLVIFCNLTKWDPESRRMSHHSPYYASGSHKAGTAWQLDSVLLDVAEIGNVDKKDELNDGQYGRISLGRYQSIFVGGVCHELGHALGLPHNKQRPEEEALWGTALMGSGNATYGQEVRKEGKGSFLTLTHALKLASHPSFSGSVKQMRTAPKTRYTQLSVEPIDQARGVRVTGQIESDIPVYAVLAYLDPKGGGDYNATTHVAVPDPRGRFSIDCTSFAGKQGRLRLVRVHANGWSRFSQDIGMNYRRDEQGRVAVDAPDLTQQRAAIDGMTLPPSAVPCPHCSARD